MKNSRSAGDTGFEANQGWAIRDLNILFLLILFALVLRLIFFTGFYGSDEVTYLQMARGILDGNWDRSDYIGSIRYGVNIPMAIFLRLFGISEFSANLWSLLTSLGEVALVYVAARKMWGTRSAFIAGIFMAVLPLHVHYAGRLMADAPLAFFVSLCFISVWMAEEKDSIELYLLAGVAAGCIFWVKDAVFYLTIAVLGTYFFAARRWHTRWFWMALSALIVVLLNCLLMWIVFDNPFHLFAVSLSSLGRANSAAIVAKKSLWFYFLYLFLDIKHVLIIFYFALGAIYVAMMKNKIAKIINNSTSFAFIWAFGFIGLLSMLSLKQVNYMLIFIAPLLLLAAYFVSSLKRSHQVFLISIFVVGGIVLSAFEQQVVQSFTANSRASVTFAEAHPNAVVFAGTGAVRAEIYQKTLNLLRAPRPPIMTLSDLDALLEGKGNLTSRSDFMSIGTTQAFAVMDPQTVGWGAPENSRWPNRLSSPCLVRSGELAPAAMGYGRYFVDGLVAVFAALSEPWATKISIKLTSTLRPQSATVFQIGAPCLVSKG